MVEVPKKPVPHCAPGGALLLLHRVHQQLPLNRSATRAMLVMILWRKDVPARDGDFIATGCAAINTWVCCCGSGRKLGVKSYVFRLRQILTMFV